MTGSNPPAADTYSLDVFIGFNQKIATITIPIGSEMEMSLAYEASWVDNGFPISPHLPFNTELSFSFIKFMPNQLFTGTATHDFLLLEYKTS